MRVYADHAATTAVSDTALAALLACLRDGGAPVYGNPSSIHGPGRTAKDRLEDARETFARYLNAPPRTITFTSGGTESDNQAIRTAAARGARSGRRHIVSTRFEHHAVLHTLSALEREGFRVTLLDIPPDGIVTAEQVCGALTAETCLVSVMYANNEIGTVQPVAEIGAVCRGAGVPLHADAVQAAGWLPLDVEELQVDYLSLSAHKFGGPQGTGVLYAREDPEPLLYGGAQERGRRAGTENLPGIVGAAAAFSEACENREANADRVRPLRDFLIAGLSAVPGAVLNGDPVRRLPGNVNVSFDGVEGEALLLLLDQRGIAASSGSACAAGALEPSHVLLALGRSPELASGALRLTFGPENTMDEARYVLSCVTEAVSYLRRAAGM